MLAIIETGGKQYLVEKGDRIKIEKLTGKAEDKINFSKVLLLGDGDDVKVGMPFIAGAKVEAKILKQGKAKKVTGVKHKPKKRYKVKFGHRQFLTEVEIMKI
jgi:large subunit ribosomal protein L21